MAAIKNLQENSTALQEAVFLLRGAEVPAMTVTDVAKELKLDWHTVKTLEKEYMQEQLRRNP